MGNASSQVIGAVILLSCVVIFVIVFYAVLDWIYPTAIAVYALPLEGKEHPSLIFNDGTLAVVMDRGEDDPLPVISMLVKQGYTIDAISNEEGDFTFTYMTRLNQTIQ
jgi:hypothetical protein